MKKTTNMKKSKINKKIVYGSLIAFAIVILVTLTIATGKKDIKELTITEDIVSTSPSDALADLVPSGLVINKSEITKTASFFPYESNGTYMEIIAVRANDDTVRTALNTCQVCYNSGRGYYEQLGDKLICNNCGNQFTIDQIELIKGGCNPVPILDEMKTEDGENIVIDPIALVAYEPLFANWKR